MQKQILFIVTSHEQMGHTDKKTGIWAEEIAKPYFMFIEAGYQVDIYSPKGGKIVFDPNSIEPTQNLDTSIERFLNLSPTAKQLNAAIDISPYAAIFLPGGHGAMWDLATDTHTANMLTQAYAANKVIGAVCHGVAGLVNAKNEAGEALVKDKKVNAFTNEEEVAAGLEDVVPFMLETRLVALGGKFEKVANWQAFAVVDGNLVTGQNPASSELVAEKILALLA